MKIKHKNALIGGLLAVVVVMAVGYAAFSQALIINGSASIDSNWQIRIIDIAASTTGSGVNAGAEVGSDYLSASFNASLTSPGDTVTYTITVENQGTINAKLSSYNWNSDTVSDTNEPIYFEVNGLNVDSVLNAQERTTFTVIVHYNNNVTMQPSVTQKEGTLLLTYVQA